MRLYWKIYLVLALTTLVTLILSIWISFSVLPAHFERLRIEKIDEFEHMVMNMQDPTGPEVEHLADSLNIVLRFFRNSQRPPFVPGHPPQDDREWRGVRLIQPTGTDFSMLASSRVAPARFFVLVLFALGLFLSQALALALGLRSVFSRISTLRQVTGEFGEGNFTARYPSSSGGDEIDRLGSAFNRMADRIISLLSSHNELLNAVAHELRTPMARLSFALELARENPQAVREKLGLMEQDLFELDRLVSELLEFNKIGSTGALTKEQVPLKGVCTGAAAGERIPDSKVKIDIVSDQDDSSVSGDYRLLLRAVSNLVRNSVRYAESSVVIRINVKEDSVEVVVTDDGPGFPPGFPERAVNPFVKGKDSRGSGLGLSIVSRIAERHGGSLALSNGADGGAVAVISIPR
ncbi:MAG: HAMP domain-containing protein [Candidatus Sabulitectum sp.]|nr:HAMP domain-containing protein [Candidatus Sabulitectum sp.]